jgi:hypothetical protein
MTYRFDCPNRELVWMHIGKKDKSCHIRQTVRYGGSSMVIGCMTIVNYEKKGRRSLEKISANEYRRLVENIP